MLRLDIGDIRVPQPRDAGRANHDIAVQSGARIFDFLAGQLFENCLVGVPLSAVGKGVDALFEGPCLGEFSLCIDDFLGLGIGNARGTFELNIREMQLLSAFDRLDRAVIGTFGDIEAIAGLVHLAAVLHLPGQNIAHLLEGVPVTRRMIVGFRVETADARGDMPFFVEKALIALVVSGPNSDIDPRQRGFAHSDRALYVHFLP